MDLNATWLGVGGKIGMQSGFGGFEGIKGRFFNLGNPHMQRDFSMASSRWGFGIGWDASIFVSIYFDTYELYWLNGTTVRDWGVNIAYGNNMKDLKETLKVGNFARNMRMVKAFWHIAAHLDEIRDTVSKIYNIYSIDTSHNPHPNVTFDLPGAGHAVEMSVFKTKGTMYLDEA